jgi:hypothetical protein
MTGAILLKMGSTGYRFVRYYTGSEPYVRKGPPALPLRLLGPVVIATSLGVIGSGIALALAGPGPGASFWILAHKGRSWHGSARCRSTCSGTCRSCRARLHGHAGDATSGRLRSAAITPIAWSPADRTAQKFRKPCMVSAYSTCVTGTPSESSFLA